MTDPNQPWKPPGESDPAPAPDPYAAPPESGQPAPSYGQPPAYGEQPPAYGQPPDYGQQPPTYGQPPAYGGQPPAYGQPQPAYGAQLPAQPGGYYPPQLGPIGQIRPTGKCILLFFVTFSIYGFVWYFKTHEEMKRHSNNGLGGGLALVIYIVFGLASPFLCSSEVGKLYEMRGAPKPVSGTTGLWVVPGFLLLLIGPFVWFIKTNNALNEYWMRSAVPVAPGQPV